MGNPISPLLVSSLIKAEFNTSHSRGEDEKAYFCVECGGSSLSRKEKEADHENHKVIRAVKNKTGVYCYKKDDIVNLGIDVTGVRFYSHNDYELYYPKPRSSSCKPNKIEIELRNQCSSCKYKVKKPGIFCSLSCKLKSDKDDDELGECSTCGTKLIDKTALFCKSCSDELGECSCGTKLIDKTALFCKSCGDEDQERRRQETKDLTTNFS